MTYSCHSAASRAQFSTSSGGSRELDGREAKRKTMHNASSISLTASMKVGYLFVNRMSLACCRDIMQTRHIPFFYNMVQTINRLVFLQTLSTAPFPPSKRTRKLLGKCFVFSQFLQDGFMGQICNIFGVIK